MDIEGFQVAVGAIGLLLGRLAIFNDVKEDCLQVLPIILLKMVGSGGIWIDLHLNLRLLALLPLIVHLVVQVEEGADGDEIRQYEVQTLKQLKEAWIVNTQFLEVHNVEGNH